MASPLMSRAPQCMSCIRRMAGSLGETFHFPAGQQVRGKKKLAKVSTVKVHLLQNIPGYGRRGSVIPVTAGMMRNIWYPKKMAEYLTAAKLEELGVKKDSTIERDSMFRSNTERKLEKQQEREEKREQEQESITPVITEEESVPLIELELLSPQQATVFLETLLPANLDFYRTPITPSQPKRVSPSIPSSSAISAAAASAAEVKEPGKSEKTGIYGSVTTSDIAANLRAILAEDEEGARVVLTPEDISFVEETDGKDRVRHLGIFEIEIRLDGAPDSVRRTIKVNAQD